jgi:hypothetical protein
MRLSSATVGLLLGLGLVFSSCGGQGGTTTGQARSATAAGGAKSSAAATISSHGKATGDPCRRQLGGFLDTMAALRRKLARGLSYDDYLKEVQATRTVYAKIPTRKLRAGCVVAVGAPAERAFNLYIDATNAWGNCLATVSCDTRAIEPELQRKWVLASRQLTLALRAT